MPRKQNRSSDDAPIHVTDLSRLAGRNGDPVAGQRRAKLALLVGGVLLTGWLGTQIGTPEIGATLLAVGWVGLLVVSVVHLFGTVLMGWAWWGLRRVGSRWIFVWGRMVRDAGSGVLPLSQIGGFVLGARAVAVHGIASGPAIASTVVDTTLEFCAQIAFTVLGLFFLLWQFPDSPIVRPAFAGVGAAAAAAVAFFVAQNRGSNFLRRVSRRLPRGWFSGFSAIASMVQAEIRHIHGAKYRLLVSFLLHFSAWTLSAAEAWLALYFMGAKISITAVLSLESLVFATRAAAFMVPGAVGIQEGAHIMLGMTFGLTPDLALGLSLLKRARDLVLGVPSLVSWQWFENRLRPPTRRSTVPATASDG